MNALILKWVNRILIILSFSLISLNSFCQVSKNYGWFELPNFTKNDLKSVSFINKNTGWVCGDSIIAKTTNGGINFIIQRNRRDEFFKQIYFFDENIGFAFSPSRGIIQLGVMLDSTSVNRDSIFADLERLNTPYRNDVNLFLKTTNGGETWFPLYNVPNIKNFFFLNSQTGWGNGHENVYKTTDGGNSWVEIYDGSNDLGEINTILFFDEFTGWIAFRSLPFDKMPLIKKTSNDGKTWTTLFRMKSISFSTFSKIETPDILDLCFPTGKVGLAVGDYGIILQTRDGGNNWYQNEKYLSEYIAFWRVTFASDLNGWIIGEDDNKYSLSSLIAGNKIILATTDAGSTWKRQSIKFIYPKGSFFNGDLRTLHSISCINDTIGYIIGSKGIILKTETGGF